MEQMRLTCPTEPRKYLCKVSNSFNNIFEQMRLGLKLEIENT